jgi:S-adenosylmethionine:tRNA ribosyltransferase-isomerase
MSATLEAPALDFTLPPELEAQEPPEARGLARDEVRLLVSNGHRNPIHARFRDLPRFLAAGDLLVVNTSATLPAAVDAWQRDGTRLELHLSTELLAGLWVVELREPAEPASLPLRASLAGETLRLPGGATVDVLAPYPRSSRLWIAALHLPAALGPYLARHGRAIRYRYVTRDWPMGSYQTVYATEPGSAEMPSAGRGFTPELITALVARGVVLAPLVLHTGVASIEGHEPTVAEPYHVTAQTARLVNTTRAAGGRVVAVGTTVVRALETVADDDGQVHPGHGWTELIVTPERGVRAVDGLLTGWHEPQASHLLLLEAVTDLDVLRMAYRAALDAGYLWHEFGDLHLILRENRLRA